jgi:N-formylglutamate deformylase
MSAVYAFHRGTTPLLLSMPHSGTEIPQAIATRLTARGRELPDTDWHVPRLYGFAADLGASVLQAKFSRYVIDLNRGPDGADLYPGTATTGLCPLTLFDGSALYCQGQEPTVSEIDKRRELFWQPYHAKLAHELQRLREIFGCALLYDAHSIASRVPRLFEGRLPDLNLGTAQGASCAIACEHAIAEVMEGSDFTQVVNGRFIGGYITRQYGDPANGIHAVQMELTQGNYLDEVSGYPYNEGKAARLHPILKRILEAFVRSVDTTMSKK